MTNALFGDITNELIDFIYTQVKKDKNKRKIKYVLDTCMNIIFSNIQVYFYSIMIILILIFCMNCFQFYYYIRLFNKATIGQLHTASELII